MCLLTLFHPLLHFHSQNARFYSMAYFFSLLMVYLTLRAREIILNEQLNSRNKVFLFMFGIIVWLPMLIHGSLIFSIVFLIVVLIDILSHIKMRAIKKKLYYLAPPLIVIGLIVGVNQAIFLKGRIGSSMIDPNVIGVKFYGSHLAHNMISLINNLGIQFWLIIPLGMIVFQKKNNRIFRITSITFIISLLLYIVLSVKSFEMRADYFLSAIPFFMIIVCYTIDRLVGLYVNESKYSNKIIYIIAVYLICLTLPGFISTSLIDGDRLNWREAANYIKELNRNDNTTKKIIIYTNSPDNISYYLNDAKYYESRQVRRMSPNTLGLADEKYFIVMPLRRAGFDDRGIVKEINDYIFEHGKLEKIVGRDRLDPHINKLAIFSIKSSS